MLRADPRPPPITPSARRPLRGSAGVALAFAAGLAACAGAPDPEPTAEPTPPPVIAAAAPAGPPRACAAIEAELGDSSEIMGAAAGMQRGMQAQVAASIGTSIASTALGFVPVPGVALVGDLVMQGVQTAQQAAMQARQAQMHGAMARVMERYQRLMAEHRAAGCSPAGTGDLAEEEG
jgi:hypothetical protein